MQALNIQLDTLSQTAKQGLAFKPQEKVQTESSFSSLVEFYSSHSAMDGRTSAELKSDESPKVKDRPENLKTVENSDPKVQKSEVKSASASKSESVRKEEASLNEEPVENTAEETEALSYFANFIPQPELPEAEPLPDASIELASDAEELSLRAEDLSVKEDSDFIYSGELLSATKTEENTTVKNAVPSDFENLVIAEDTADLPNFEEKIHISEDQFLYLKKEPLSKSENNAVLPEELSLSGQVEEELVTLAKDFSNKDYVDRWSREQLMDIDNEEKPVFTVQDLRSAEEKVLASKETDGDTSSFNFNQGQDSSATITLTLPQFAETNALPSDGTNLGSFQQLLTEQIQSNAPEFVKATNFVLRDGNQGTIDMILKPEQLGNVKVSLQLSDKVVVGQITVASKEAMEAFKQSLDTLKQAFVQNGFENATLTLSLADGSAANNSAFAGHEQQAGQQLDSERAYGSYVASGDADAEESVSAISSAFRADGSRYTIDVVA